MERVRKRANSARGLRRRADRRAGSFFVVTFGIAFVLGAYALAAESLVPLPKRICEEDKACD